MHFVGPTVKNAVLFQQAGSMAQGWIPAQMPTFSSVSSASAPCSLPTISPFPLIWPVSCPSSTYIESVMIKGTFSCLSAEYFFLRLYWRTSQTLLITVQRLHAIK